MAQLVITADTQLKIPLNMHLDRLLYLLGEPSMVTKYNNVVTV